MSIEKSKNNRQDLRVMQKNMVYCSGLPSNLTQDQLTSSSYFGQYGKIQKIVVNQFPNRNYCSVYLTYSHQFEAALTILACNQFQISRSTLWCLFGTMKYCRFFLKKIECKNIPNCPYLHTLDSKNQIEIQNSPSEAFPEHVKMAKQVIMKYPQKTKQLKTENKAPGQLPEPLYALQYLQQQNEEDNTEQEQNRAQQVVAQKDRQIESNGNRQKQSIVNYNSQQIEVDVQNIIKNLILKHLEKNKGSRLMTGIKQQEKNIKQIILTTLLE